MRILRIAALAVSAIVLLSCNHSGMVNPAAPEGHTDVAPVGLTQSVYQSGTNRYLWGLWEIRISADHQSAEVVPLHGAVMHLNTVRLLEHAACTNCLRIGNVRSYPPNELGVDLTLVHPYPGLLKYTAFDVRGVFISSADYTFPAGGRSIAWGDDMARIMNADGYTSLFNPTEFPETTPPALGYIRGRYSTGGDLSATLNPYIAYAEDAPRRMFEAGSTQTRTVRLRLPDGPLEFGYAVDGCWQLVPGEVTDPLTDFPPDANCLEAYRIDVQVGPGLVPGGGSAPILADVYDHQGLDTISSVTLEAPDLFAGELALSFSTVTGEESFQFAGIVDNDLGAAIGEYPLVVRVADLETDQNLGAVDAWDVCTVDVREKEGWAQTWGLPTSAYGYGIVLDSLGNIYVAGHFFTGTADFDPGSGADDRTSNGGSDACLSKFDPKGQYQWVRTWGGEEEDCCRAIAVDDFGNVYVTGSFGETVDFDPGPGIDEHESNGYTSAYLSKFDSSGEFQWARTWGSNSLTAGWAVGTDAAASVYVSGKFGGVADFDPGPGKDDRGSNGSTDVFLSKFDSGGVYQWGRTWGGGAPEFGYGLAIGDASDIYVVGAFKSKSVDFDPGPGTDEHENPSGWADAFLSKFDSNGDFYWARTWGGTQDDIGWGAALEDSGYIYVTGEFAKTVDFDPGPDTEEHKASWDQDAFLSRFDLGGEFQWARTWGGYGSDTGQSVAADSSGNIYVSGQYSLTVDFDPGPGIEEYTANGLEDVFLSKFHSSGEFQWARTWGGTIADDYGYAIDISSSGNVYLTGIFAGIVDFDPGLGSDIHDCNGYYNAFLSKFPPNGDW